MVASRLMPESALTAPKEKRLNGREWFESGRASSAVSIFFPVFFFARVNFHFHP
ncbi:hypothetical protein HanHA300_Chr04g0116551 [Helianthus annuus]|nr:hypothetical protein HanHA300_Chr04g0116551 [Helianthus annuus]